MTENSAVGVVTCPDLAEFTVKDILNSLEEQGVTNMRRLNKRLNDGLVATNTFVLTFSSKDLSQTLPISWISLRFLILNIPFKQGESWQRHMT